MFGIIQKKGDENNLCGRVIGYVKIPPPEPGNGMETPFDALVSPDGILAIQGDYSKIPDFDAFRNNLQQSLPKGLQEILKHILEDDELRENLDKAKKISFSVIPQKGSDRLGDFFPVPAQLTLFQSEEALLSEEGDIYFLGEYASMSSAHLFLTGFPIIYQAKYREQTELQKAKEVDELLSEIGGDKKTQNDAELEGLTIHLTGDLNSFNGNLLNFLDTQVLPKIMYIIERNDNENFKAGINSFRSFMHSYPHQQDIEKMISILQSINEKKYSSSSDSKILTLLCKKISALHHEEFEMLPEIQKELEAVIES
ncbi:MAG: hypothetical protein LBC87_06575 [Fibromonadaceae bacterium]|nr:hypothetical protein [Fibromonadaceae bacterium]